MTAASQIFNRYCSYITATLRLAEDNLNSQIEKILREPGSFAKGPIVEILPPYKPGRTIDELTARGLLERDFRDLDHKVLPSDRILYLHQEKAIETICTEGKAQSLPVVRAAAKQNVS